MQKVRNYTIEEEAKNNQQWGEDFVVMKFFHIGETIQHLPMYMLENDQHYYVDMPQTPIVRKQQLEKNIVVNLDEGSPEGGLEEIQQFPNLTKKSMRMHNFTLFPYLLAKHTKGKEPLIDYSQSHVVTSF
jgi:hypothetical protein